MYHSCYQIFTFFWYSSGNWDLLWMIQFTPGLTSHDLFVPILLIIFIHLRATYTDLPHLRFCFTGLYSCLFGHSNTVVYPFITCYSYLQHAQWYSPVESISILVATIETTVYYVQIPYKVVSPDSWVSVNSLFACIFFPSACRWGDDATYKVSLSILVKLTSFYGHLLRGIVSFNRSFVLAP